MSVCLTPWWLFAVLAKTTGELREYVRGTEDGSYGYGIIRYKTIEEWHCAVCLELLKLIDLYMTGNPDQIKEISERHKV
jgi:hypothetical protein